MLAVAVPDLLSDGSFKTAATSIKDRLSEELVIALVGPVGSGASTAAGMIKDILDKDFGYTVPEIIKPSKFIKQEMHRVGMSQPDKEPLGNYIDTLQTAGNELRKKFHADYLAEKVIEDIYKKRLSLGGYGVSANGAQVIQPGRRAYIIDSIKNKDELNLLRQLYGDTFILVGVFAPDDLRKQRLIDKDVDKAEVSQILDRDKGELMTFGQKTRDVFTLSDLFICNDKKPDELRRRLMRHMELLFDVGFHTPSKAETAMFSAASAAANSACMSRQVGASIVSRDGELISVGYNDVPRYEGGVYCEDNRHFFDKEKGAFIDEDHRCYNWRSKVCHNEKRRRGLLSVAARKLKEAGVIKKGVRESEVEEKLSGTPIDALIEYSRSIHAEMEAILAVAREGRHSIVGSTLYTTTYPCHNCARHIVAAGIAAVVYVEPYQKSLAMELHNDSIMETEADGDGRHVVFKQFDGVAPRNYLKLFKPTRKRKTEGRAREDRPKAALPVFRMQLDGISDYEAKVVADLESKEQTVS
ncbi:MAG: hypothetical protein HY055_13840 [Magnetospirillum sp.]|nr:hypothetical protein [Magnetospirillum sp.]